VFFAIASLALSVVLFTFIVNWDYVGGARGAYVLQPREVPFGLPRYIHLLYIVMVLMAAVSLIVARTIEKSTIGPASRRSATTSSPPSAQAYPRSGSRSSPPW